MKKKTVIKIGSSVLRWGIAVVGLWWVLHQISWRDQAIVILPNSPVPQRVNLADTEATDDWASYRIIDPSSGKIVTLNRNDVVNEPDTKKPIKIEGDSAKKFLLAVDLSNDQKPIRLYVADNLQGQNAQWILPAQAPNYVVTVPHPRVQVGVIRMVDHANFWYLLGSVLVIPITFLVTSYRWHELLKALDVQITLGRAFVLNMVGLFFNTFLPGTGGDVVKAVYVAKQTHHGTRAAMSVLVDRVIGLIALLILGGVMAAYQWHIPTCRRVAIGGAIIIGCTVLALLIFYVPLLHRISGLEFIISKLPAQKHVKKIVETMNILGRRPLLVTWAVLISFPVHMTVVVSALLAGKAFGLPIPTTYYWMAVPVIVLAGAIPISPQGAGVMEVFALKLLEPQGVTAAQAVALTMSIRLVQMLWNLTGGFFVMRGGYHAPSETEKNLAEDDGTPLPV